MKSELVKYIFKYAERELNYLILRNYENLPDNEGHDIDFLIDETELIKTTELVHAIRDTFNVRIFKRQQYYGLCGYAIVIGETVLHLDFFTHVQWNRFDIIPTGGMLQRKKRYKESFWVINDEDLYYYCWVMFIRANGNIKDKYKHYAFEWEDRYNKNSQISIRKGLTRKNKKRLICYMVKCTTIRTTIQNTLANIRFKLWKLTCMDGRIYVLDNLETPIIRTARRFCSCNRLDIQSAKDLSLFSFIKLLYREYSVGISPMEWNRLWWHYFVPKIYVINHADNLVDVVRNIYRDAEIK